MDYIGCWNTSQTYLGEHRGYLANGSVTVGCFSIPVETDAEAIEYAKELAKEQDYFLLSIRELKGCVPPFKIREILFGNVK